MPLRFRRTLKILPGVRLNYSKSGISTSIGVRGAHLTLGRRGIRRTVGIPGTGLSWTETVAKLRRAEADSANAPAMRLAEPEPTMPPEPTTYDAGIPDPSNTQPIPALQSVVGANKSSIPPWLIVAIAVLCGGGLVIGAIVAALFPPAPPTLDMNAINTSAVLTAWAPSTMQAIYTSAILTAWAPVTLTQAAKVPPIVSVEAAATAAPEATQTFPPLPSPTPWPTYPPPPTAVRFSAPTSAPAPAGGGSSGGCCKICVKGQACGNSCISRSYTCHQPPGCACQGG